MICQFKTESSIHPSRSKIQNPARHLNCRLVSFSMGFPCFSHCSIGVVLSWSAFFEIHLNLIPYMLALSFSVSVTSMVTNQRGQTHGKNTHTQHTGKHARNNTKSNIVSRLCFTMDYYLKRFKNTRSVDQNPRNYGTNMQHKRHPKRPI